MMETAAESVVHKALRLVFGMKIETLTACGVLTCSPPDGDASYRWPDVTCPKCKATEPKGKNDERM